MPRYDCWILLIETLLSDLLSRVLHAYSVVSQRKAPFSSETVLGFLFIFLDLFPWNFESTNTLRKRYQESKGFGRFVF